MGPSLFTEHDVATAPAGIYQVTSGTDAYFPAMALLEVGEATYLGEVYQDGARIVRLALGASERGLGEVGARQISISHEFFSTALKDYRNWPLKWWREAVQNSVDAGATVIRLGIEQQPDSTWLVWIEDDGGGMSRDILVDKFLMLGATTKVGQGGVAGGFGKAKELLLLPWISWLVHTRDSLAEGSGIAYNLSDAPYRAGTRLEVRMPPDKTTTEAMAIEFVKRCYLPSITFTVNGKPVQADLVAEQLVAQGGGVDVFYLKGEVASNYCYVRTRGLYMFDVYINEIRGHLIAELTVPSIEVLTANRDGFSSYPAARVIDNLATRIAKDNKSALRKQQGLIQEKYRGSGKFRGKKAESALLSQVEAAETKLSTHDVGRLLTVLEQLEGSLGRLATPQAATIMLDQHFRGPNHIQAAIAQLAWEPDFFLDNEREGWKVPKKFFPATMAPRVRKLAKVWTELCRYVMMQLGSDKRFGVGFVFSKDAGAMASTTTNEEGEKEEWLLVNPIKPTKLAWQTKPDFTGDDIWSPSKDEDLKWLYAAAIHEATHLADGLEMHDESFASALTLNMARCADGYRKVRAIAATVKMEGQVLVDE